MKVYLYTLISRLMTVEGSLNLGGLGPGLLISQSRVRYLVEAEILPTVDAKGTDFP